MESVYLLAEHWTSHAGSSSGSIFADLLHLLLLPLAIPDCTGYTSQKVGTTTTVCCTLLQVTRLHMLHISNGNNNKSNRSHKKNKNNNNKFMLLCTECNMLFKMSIDIVLLLFPSEMMVFQ